MKGGRIFSVVSGAVALLVVSCETPAKTAGPVEPAPVATTKAAPSQPAAGPVNRRDLPVTPNKEEVAKKPPAPVPAKPTPKPAPVEISKPEPSKPKGQISEMDLATLFELQEDGRAFVVDVRPGFFYNIDHIPGAVSMPLKSYEVQLPARKVQLDSAVSSGKVIVLYCADENCPDGRSTARKLALEGYSTAVYTGGWKEWKSSGL